MAIREPTLSEIDEDIDFSEYDANEDGGVDLFMIMMDYPFDAGQAHISWYELVNDTLRIDDYVTNDTTADGDSVVIQQQRSLIVWVDSVTRMKGRGALGIAF
ncbi:MAG: hypothetical protein IPK53_17715 [bacterium]|nr:hypothetical protein [bacterium]